MVPLGARLQQADGTSQAEVPAWQGASGIGLWGQKLRALRLSLAWAGMPHEGLVRHLSRAGRARSLSLEPRTGSVVPGNASSWEGRREPGDPGEVAAR